MSASALCRLLLLFLLGNGSGGKGWLADGGGPTVANAVHRPLCSMTTCGVFDNEDCVVAVVAARKSANMSSAIRADGRRAGEEGCGMGRTGLWRRLDQSIRVCTKELQIV